LALLKKALGARFVTIYLKNSETVNIYGENILSTKYVLHFSLLLSIQTVFRCDTCLVLGSSGAAKYNASHRKKIHVIIANF
jgi:hypothetical protein